MICSSANLDFRIRVLLLGPHTSEDSNSKRPGSRGPGHVHGCFPKDGDRSLSLITFTLGLLRPNSFDVVERRPVARTIEHYRCATAL